MQENLKVMEIFVILIVVMVSEVQLRIQITYMLFTITIYSSQFVKKSENGF